MPENSATEPRTPPLRRARRALLAAGAAAALACGCSPASIKAPLLLHPVPPTADQYALEQGALVFSGPDFRISARPWDYRLVAAEMSRAGGTSPFGEGEDAAGRFLFFRVRLENRSTRSLVFNPMRGSLLFPGEAPLPALENSDFVAFADEDAAAAEARAAAFRRVSFDITATVRAGQTLERYLVFRSPAEAPKTAILLLDDLWLGTASFDVRFVFETFPGKEPPAKGRPSRRN